jgi:hypothetical protein
MIKPIKQKRCKSCKELFTPTKRGLTLSKYCTSACELDDAENVNIAKKKKKPAKEKTKTAAWLKTNKLWPVFSLHQKLVHSDDGAWCKCYTCDKPIEIGTANCQGGHCLSKAVYKNLYFDERAVRPQCYYCNINLGGMHYDFCEKLKQEIGLDAFNDMKLHGRDIVKRDAKWYLEKIEYYTKQNEMIIKNRCWAK